jgi:AcrR family transcriptional regulator
MRYGREELERAGAVAFNLDTVLRKSKVARSSLYHHFTNREGFIIALEIELSLRRQMQELELIRAFFETATSTEQIVQAIQVGLVMAGSREGQVRREHRVESLAAAMRSKKLHKLLADAQLVGTGHLIDTFQAAEKRGVISLRAPIDGVAYVIQSLFVGRTLVDLIDDQRVDDDWVEAATVTIRHLLGGTN